VVPNFPDGSPMPPTPMEATQKALSNHAEKAAKNAAYNWFMKQIRPFLPSTIVNRLERQAEKAVSNLIWGCVFTIVFFGIAFMIIVPIGLYVAFEVIRSL
jgi:hypothetical protein